MIGSPMFRTARLTIEPLGHEHAEGLFAALDDNRVGTFIGGADVTTVEALHDRIDGSIGPAWPTGHWHNWVARRSDDSVIVGRLEATTYGETRPTGKWAEVAYLFGPAFWGRGYAIEGVSWMLDHLRDELVVEEIWAAVHPGNVRSIRLLERLGFEPRDTPGRPMGSYDEIDLVFVRFADRLRADDPTR
jgi:RimJ/RimL family protein N-acetyltransferase